MTAALGLISVLTLKFPPFRAFYLSHPRYILQLPDTLLDTFVTLLPCLARQSANPERSKSPPRAVQTAVPVEAQGNQAERSVSGNGEEGVTPPAQTVQPRFPRSSHQKVAIATLKVLQTLAWCPEEGCLPRFVMLPFLFFLFAIQLSISSYYSPTVRFEHLLQSPGVIAAVLDPLASEEVTMEALHLLGILSHREPCRIFITAPHALTRSSSQNPACSEACLLSPYPLTGHSPGIVYHCSSGLDYAL